MSVDELSVDARRSLAEHWSDLALLEHASVASFSLFSLQLLSVGAPATLVEGAHRAALDEILHARLAFRLASRYRGEPVAPGPLPVADANASLDSGLVALAVSTAREGCVGETVGAVEARAAFGRAADEQVREMLAIVERDESAHAELAWRTVRWAIDHGGAAVRDAVAAALTSELHAPLVTPPERAGDPELLAAHGLLPPTDLVEIRRRALADVVRPSMIALLGAR